MDDEELIAAAHDLARRLGGIGNKDARLVRGLIVRFQAAKEDRADRMAGFVAEAEGLAHRLRLHAGLEPSPAPPPGEAKEGSNS